MSFSYLSLVKLISGVFFTFLFLWLLLKDQSFAQVFNIISGINIWTFLLSLLLVSLSQFIRIVRWWRMLNSLSYKISLAACISPYLMSTAVNNLVPLRLGDVYRIFGFRKQLGIPGSQIFSTIISERLLDVIALCSFLLIGLYGLTKTHWQQDIVLFEITICFAILICLWSVMKARWLKALLSKTALWELPIFSFSTHESTLKSQNDNDAIETLSGRDQDSKQTVSNSWQVRILQILHALDILRTFPVSIQLLGLTILSWSVSAAVYTIIAVCLAPEVDMKAAWLALSSANFGILLPGGPASLGTFDYFAAVGLIAYGVSKTVATSFALTMHAVLWGPTTIMGIFCFVLQSFPGANNIDRQEQMP